MKIAQLTSESKSKLLKQKLERENIRKMRLEREQEEGRLFREKMRLEEEEAAKLREQRRNEFKQAVVQAQEETSAAASSSVRHRPSKRKKVLQVSAPQLDPETSFDSLHSDSFFSTPSWPEIQKLEQTTPIANTQSIRYSVDDLETLSTFRVLYSDTELGTGLWGENMGSWCKRMYWNDFIQQLNSLWMKRFEFVQHINSDERSRPIFNSGEYNFVVSGSEVSKFIAVLPYFCDTNKINIKLDDIVFRMSRPDVGSELDDLDDDGHDGHDGHDSSQHDNRDVKNDAAHNDFYRYKPLVEQCTEMKAVLDAAASGFGVPCYACFSYPASAIVNRHATNTQLFGSVYVLKRGAQNLNGMCTDKINAGLMRHDNASDVKASIGRGISDFVMTKLLPTLVQQAKSNILNLDCKPGNILVCTDQSVFVVDFDSAMCADVSNFAEWEPCLFINLLLLCVHIRCWNNQDFANAFISPLKPLLLELAVYTRACKFLRDCTVRNGKFKSHIIQSCEDAKDRLESIVYAYFAQSPSEARYKLNPALQMGKPLLSQLMKFAMTGKSTSTERSICRAFGEV